MARYRVIVAVVVEAKNSDSAERYLFTTLNSARKLDEPLTSEDLQGSDVLKSGQVNKEFGPGKILYDDHLASYKV